MTDQKDLQKDYAAAQFGGQLLPGRWPALILVDFVMAYFDPKSPLYAGVESALESAKRLLEAARKAGIPILFTNVNYSPGGKDGGVFYRKVGALKCFERGNPLGAFPPNLHPGEGELVISKHYASAFFGTSLSSTLTALAVDTLIITGLSTSGCVRATAVDACQHGFVPLVVREAVGDRDSRPHEASLFDLQAKYAEVVSEAFVMSYLARDVS
ncbi:N-carbamoylsarcosine amidohydrolase [Luteithermobacter gelatinilyticus]|uniref:N-carbamoylsarcosine amidohydrolase n=1 Tax=Luteithermobacter gelatinilyticus TaxID=2582913 RepID=UPI001105AAC7|nr:N-carbamoylsarcosine amidohydrolase [Luteithermobacter gelatinilyticus]